MCDCKKHTDATATCTCVCDQPGHRSFEVAWGLATARYQAIIELKAEVEQLRQQVYQLEAGVTRPHTSKEL